MCNWECFCTFAREPERRKVGGDARVAVDGVANEVDPNLAGETVVLWWGLFDNELYFEHGDKRSGPLYPMGGPILLHQYRAHKKTRHERYAERVEALAGRLELARAAVSGGASPSGWEQPMPPLAVFSMIFLQPAASRVSRCKFRFCSMVDTRA